MGHQGPTVSILPNQSLKTKTELQERGAIDLEKRNLIIASMHCFKITSNSLFFIFIETYLKVILGQDNLSL